MIPVIANGYGVVASKPRASGDDPHDGGRDEGAGR